MATAQHAFDRTPPVFAPGEKIRLSVVVEVDDPAPVEGTVQTTTIITLPDGTKAEPVITESTYTVDEAPGTATTAVTRDSTGRGWNLVSTTGNNTVWEATA